METSILDRASEFLRRHRDDRRSQALLLFLALLVAVATAALLTQPGQAMTHRKKVLDCPLEVHQHTKECYDEDENLICGYADYVVHVHNDDCYDDKGNLVCPIPEHKAHRHTPDCFREEKVLVCGQEESEGHEHSKKCYEKVRGKLICDKEETKGHKHDENCYNEEGKLTCDKEEEKPHEHTDECYEWTEELTCGKEESEGHKHTDECYEVQNVCVCGELELHTHDKECCDKDGKLICGQLELREHVHGPECFREEELTDEEVAALNQDNADAQAGEPDACPAAEESTGTESVTEGAEAPADEATDTDLTDEPVDAATGTDLGAVPADASTSAEGERPEDVETITKVYRDKEIEATAEYTAAANLPEEAELRVRLATKEDIARAKKDGDDDDSDRIFYMIGFYVGDKEVEPEGPVTIRMRFIGGQFKGKETLSIDHYAREGVEEFTAQTQQDEEGYTEAAFTTNSFSLFELSTNFRLEQMVSYSAPKYEKGALDSCGVSGCNNSCNLKWYIYNDGTAKVSGVIDKSKKYFHIHNKVSWNGVDYLVTNLEAIDNCSPYELKDKKVEIDDDLARRMVGGQDFSLPQVDAPPSDTAMEQEGYTPGESNNTSDYLMWKKAGYNAENNQAEISLKYYQKVKEKPPIDLVFVLDDSHDMWNCCSKNSLNGLRARAGLYQRAMVQAICQSLMTNSNDVRVAFVNYSGCNRVQDSGGFFSRYEDAREWLQTHYLKKDSCTDYDKAADAATELITSKSDSSRLPAVVWFSSFSHCLDSSDRTAAARLKQAATGGVFTVSFKHDCHDVYDYGHSDEIATINPKELLAYKKGCCGADTYDPTHMFLASDMSNLFSSMEMVIKELMGFYVGWDTVVRDVLSDGINALDMTGHGGDGYANRYASRGQQNSQDLYWLLVDVQNQQRLQAGKLYEHHFTFQLDGKKVYSGHMPTNTYAKVEKNSDSVNQITESPRLKKPVELVLEQSTDGKVIPDAVFELYDESGKKLWSGTSDENGVVRIPYGFGDNQVPFEENKQYHLKETGGTKYPVIRPTGEWTLSVDEHYIITSQVTDPSQDPNTLPMQVDKGRFLVFNNVDASEPTTFNIYWVKRNPNGTVSALEDDADHWWEHDLMTLTTSFQVGQWGAAHFWPPPGSNASAWTPETMPTQQNDWKPPLYRLYGYGIGPDFGSYATTDEMREKVGNVTLEKLYSGENYSLGVARFESEIKYFQIKIGNDHYTDETLDGNMAGKAVYFVYEDIRPINLTVRKVWQDRDEGKTHENDTVTFTITPQGGEVLTNEDGTPRTFTLTAADAVEGQNNVWETTLEIPRSGSYTVTETNVKPGYGITYHTETLEDGTPNVIAITNIEGAELPSTGGPGTSLYTIGGTAILVGGLLYGLQLWRRREEAAE